jgi:CDGSH-type Zn-finger protein
VSDPAVEIKVRDDGPYKVTGPIRLIDVEGNEFDVPPGEAVVLCRCGHSQEKPFCDASHKRCGFESQVRAG